MKAVKKITPAGIATPNSAFLIEMVIIIETWITLLSQEWMAIFIKVGMNQCWMNQCWIQDQTYLTSLLLALAFKVTMLSMSS